MHAQAMGALIVGLLMGPVAPGGAPGRLLGLAKEQIDLRTTDGRWNLVTGIATDPPPPAKDAVTIAVIDSGVADDHPQLRTLIAEQKDFTGEGTYDRIGHGTVVAILVRPNGPGPSPRLLVAKVANADGTIAKSSVIEAIRWAAGRGAKVVNLSLGFRDGTDDYSDLCKEISRHGNVIFVAAAGNWGPHVKAYPAACQSENVMCVGTPDDYSGPCDLKASGSVVLAPAPQEAGAAAKGPPATGGAAPKK